MACAVCGHEEHLPPLMGVDGLQRNYELADRVDTSRNRSEDDDFQPFQALQPATVVEASAQYGGSSSVAAAPLQPVATSPPQFDPFGDLTSEPARATAATPGGSVEFLNFSPDSSAPPSKPPSTVDPFATSTSFLATPGSPAVAVQAKPAPPPAQAALRENLTDNMDEFAKFLLTEAKNSTPVSANPYFPQGDPFAMPAAPPPVKKAPLDFLSSPPAQTAPTPTNTTPNYKISAVVPTRATESSSLAASSSASTYNSTFPMGSSPPSSSSTLPPQASASSSSSSSSMFSSITPSWLSLSSKDTSPSKKEASKSGSSASSSSSWGVTSFFGSKSSATASPSVSATAAAASTSSAASSVHGNARMRPHALL